VAPRAYNERVYARVLFAGAGAAEYLHTYVHIRQTHAHPDRSFADMQKSANACSCVLVAGADAEER